MTKWCLGEALVLCEEVEAISPNFGAHVALTGGLLYKKGQRKDCDLLFYCIRQIDEIDEGGLLAALTEIGFTIKERKGWVRKAEYGGKQVDLFFPEKYPSSSKQMKTGEY